MTKMKKLTVAAACAATAWMATGIASAQAAGLVSADGPVSVVTPAMSHMSGMPHTATMGAAPAMTKMVGGAAMFPGKDIVDNAVNSKDHTTLVAAVKAAGLVDTLKSPGPFTVFAPTNSGFAALPAGTVDSLLKPENKAALTKVLTYHVVPGRIDAATLARQIAQGGGKAMLKTASGGALTAMMRGNEVVIQDDKGGTSAVTIADVFQSNGVIHVVDKVLLPG